MTFVLDKRFKQAMESNLKTFNKQSVVILLTDQRLSWSERKTVHQS